MNSKLYILALTLLLSGCGALDIASSLLPSKPAVEANLAVEVSKGKKESIETEIGTETSVRADAVDTISTNNFGLDITDLVILLATLVALGLPASYMFYRIGLSRPRPLKYTSEGRRLQEEIIRSKKIKRGYRSTY